ncbi:GNAT family N-acetyltransferase [Mycolicibacterium duvalii]|uniref:GNAT family N-acetyltransferase n=1 Tax=Mycolicibacterium duvalii TaxID=39688 RepID=UPI001F438065|nr:GNAT family N-acetyltransferase [Mycolicibacterium duvalii]
MVVLIGPADPARVAELAELAARTFPLACPPSAGPADIAAFVAENLTAARFSDYLRDPDRIVLTATDGDRIVGYAMTICAAADDPDVAAVVSQRPAVELSKIYVAPQAHGTGASAALMSAVLRHAAESGAACVWLGVNQKNARAQRFYRKHGFTQVGTKTFRLGTHIEHDYVMARPV